MIFKTEFDQTFTCGDYSKTVRIPIRGKNPKSQGAEICAKVTPLPDNCHECPFLNVHQYFSLVPVTMLTILEFPLK